MINAFPGSFCELFKWNIKTVWITDLLMQSQLFHHLDKKYAGLIPAGSLNTKVSPCQGQP
jgi:hypothetical protein